MFKTTFKHAHTYNSQINIHSPLLERNTPSFIHEKNAERLPFKANYHHLFLLLCVPDSHLEIDHLRPIATPLSVIW